MNAIEGDHDHPLNCGVPMQIHHLLSKKGAIESGNKSILESYGYDINEIGNLVALPSTFAGACHLEVQLHRGNHISFSNSDDDDELYHDYVQKLMVKTLKKIEKECEEGSAKKVQSRMNSKSKVLLSDLKLFRIRLTRVHKYFKNGNCGCNGLGTKIDKFSIDDLAKSENKDDNICNRNHSEFTRYKKRVYTLEVGSVNYNNEYYVMTPNFDLVGFKVIPTESTALRRFHYRKQIYGEPALRFYSKGNKIIDNTMPMLFCTPSVIISESLKELIDDNIYGGSLYPVIINEECDNYFLINIYEELDCWDRSKSTYEQQDPDEDPHVINYHLDVDVLDKIKESERLLFKMGGDDLSPFIVHDKIKRKIEKKVPYVNFFSLETYQLGDEY
ncbi:AHH domain-containing protein [Vibrio tasmaniensis]|uniref:AHH domain-containing protein n=1 Tax=Vibrio tasmaniensis TaxID=212663 RepID=UPI001436B57F|nr:AHH domain-containing protein [Vibrio tasmaniensis]